MADLGHGMHQAILRAAASARQGGARVALLLRCLPLCAHSGPAFSAASPLQVRQESGINSFADLANLLEEAPRALLDSLRLSAVVRHSGTQAGRQRRGWLNCGKVGQRGGEAKGHRVGDVLGLTGRRAGLAPGLPAHGKTGGGGLPPLC